MQSDKGKLVVYTAIFGANGDRARPLVGVVPHPDVSYVCFTDRPSSVPAPWKAREAKWKSKDNRRTARFHKILCHQVLPDFDRWLWIDGCLQVRADPRRLVLDCSDSPLAVFRHPHRNCLYKEAEACKKFRKDSPDLLRQQIEAYRFKGYPPSNGLAETACVLRRRTPEIVQFNDAWWNELRTHSVRDQVSFPFAVWLCGLTFDRIPGCRDRSSYFNYYSHVRHQPGRIK